MMLAHDLPPDRIRWAKTWPRHPEQIGSGPRLHVAIRRLWVDGTESDVGSRIPHIRSDPSRLTGYDKTYTMNPCFVFRDSRLRPIVYSYKLSLWLTAYSDLLFIIISCLYG